MDEFLKQLGYNLRYEDLKDYERKTLHEWLDKMQKHVLTTEDIMQYVKSMRNVVENELTKTSNSKEEDYLLKARLRNYMLLEAFLTTPDRAKRALQKALEGVEK